MRNTYCTLTRPGQPCFEAVGFGLTTHTACAGAWLQKEAPPPRVWCAIPPLDQVWDSVRRDYNFGCDEPTSQRRCWHARPKLVVRTAMCSPHSFLSEPCLSRLCAGEPSREDQAHLCASRLVAPTTARRGTSQRPCQTCSLLCILQADGAEERRGIRSGPWYAVCAARACGSACLVQF